MLSAIAKKAGKLLKGGEPDQESVAKMILNDWIRGKIPYFAPPPEKALNATVAPQPTSAPVPAGETSTTSAIEPTKKDAPVEYDETEQERNLGKLLGERRVKGVEQAIGKVVVMTKFMGDDARRHEEEEDEEMSEGDGYDKSEDEEEEGEEEEAVGWDDIFGAEGGPSAKVVEAGSDAELKDDEDKRTMKKRQRKTRSSLLKQVRPPKRKARDVSK